LVRHLFFDIDFLPRRGRIAWLRRSRLVLHFPALLPLSLCIFLIRSLELQSAYPVGEDSAPTCWLKRASGALNLDGFYPNESATQGQIRVLGENFSTKGIDNSPPLGIAQLGLGLTLIPDQGLTEEIMPVNPSRRVLR